MSINWDQIGQEWFDRIVEVLIKRRYREADSVIAVNGRGGDGGIDIEVRQGARLRIFQLKYFPGGFSGGWTRRRTQIKRSYNKMLPEKPYEWILVVPDNVIQSERKYVKDLASGSAAPRWRIIGRLELDDMLIDFPAVDKWAQRNVTSQLREDAKLYGQERSSLLRSEDLGERVAALGELVDSADPDWTFDIHRVGSTVSQVLRPQHPGAYESSPVSVSFQTRFGPEHAALARRYQRKVGFGTAERLELPAETVQDVEIAGPPHIARRFDSASVVIGDPQVMAPGVVMPVELRFTDEDGALFGSHEGRISNLGTGPHGMSMKATLYDERVSVELTFAPSTDEQVAPPAAELSTNIGGARPRVVADVMGFVRQMRTTRKLEVFINGDFVLSVLAHADTAAEEDDELIVEEFATDLDIVQRHCGQHFAYPVPKSDMERVALRVARIVIEGGIVATPDAGVVTVAWPEQDFPQLQELLDTERGQVAFRFDYAVRLGDRVLPIGLAWVFHDAVEVLDAQAARDALEAGDSDSITVAVRVVGGEYFFVASAEQSPDHLDEKLETLWQLHGITQPRPERQARGHETSS
ncbi:hypothetical protein [Nocardia sp. NPDC051832]|uniref:hypothetical protein n=1 Tax=Nocardia sp. NPDC051832 TaxID=3155673 RepID=UPI0034304C98